MAEFVKKPVAVLVNVVPTNRQHLGATTLEGLQARGFAVVPVMVMERAALADLGADGLPALERDRESKASREILELFHWLCQQVGIASSPLAAKPS